MQTSRASLLLGAAALAVVGCAASEPPPRMLPDAALCPHGAGEDGARVVTRFYEAFGRHDFAGMACSYDPDVEFTDSIFGTLRGKRALAMWAMLVSQGKDLEIVFSQVHADGNAAQAHWDAHYTFHFLAFSNDVHNSVDATFELRDGKIVRHRDQFDLRRWMKMALSPFGGAVSESTIRSAVQSKLDDFIEKHPEFQEPKRP